MLYQGSTVLNLTQKWTEAITGKKEYNEDGKGIS